MELWQKSHITENLVELIEGTICNEIILAHLLALKVLANIDKEDVQARPTNSARAERLYNLISGRISGYLGVMGAVSKCEQSGPFKILMKGVLKHGIPNVFITTACGGAPVRLRTILANDDFSELEGKLRENLLDEKCLEMILKAQKKEHSIALVKDTIPPPVPYYIPRRLSKRCKINPEMFKVKCLDVMVFAGIERHKLSELVSPNLTSSSTLQLHNISCGFIYLENEADWEEICKNSEVPIHLIKYEKENNKDSFILVKTTMPTEILRQHLHGENADTEMPSISEEEFTEVCQHPGGVCVCDTPGTGKTILLASLARSIAKKYPNKIVCFIPIAKFVQQQKLQLQEICDKNSVQKFIVNYISTCNFSQKIILNKIKTKMTSLALFFDGFDEVLYEDVDTAKRFLKMLVKLPKTQVYVTARPHMRKDLEETLGATAYDIIPFTEPDQINYLTNYWKQSECLEQDQIKLTQFAEFCLTSIKKNLNTEDRDMMGIPLQCYLLAEVNKRNSQLYSDPRRLVQPEVICVPVKTVYDMYKQFMNSKISEETTTSIDTTALSTAQKLLTTVNNLYRIFTRHVSNKDKVMKYHVWKALEIFDPEISNMYFNEEKLDQSLSVCDILKFGVMEGKTASWSEHGIQFVHQTMAEYFVAEFLAELLINNSVYLKYTREFQEFFYRFFTSKILRLRYNNTHDVSNVDHGQRRILNKRLHAYKFDHSVITTFLNERIATMSPRMVNSLLIKQLIIDSPGDTLTILQACITHKFNNLFNFFKHQVNSLHESSTIQNIYKNLISLSFKPTCAMRIETVDSYFHRLRSNSYSDDDVFLITEMQCIDQREIFVFLCALYGDVTLTEGCFQLVRECFGHDLHAFCAHIPHNELTPLHVAIQEGNYEMVEYFANKISLEGRRLLCYCLENTYNNDLQIVENKTKIWRFLLDKNRTLCDEVDDEGEFYLSESLSSEKVHIGLVKCIVEENAQFLKWDGGSFVIKATEFMSSTDFHELSVYLISHKTLYELFPLETLHHVFSQLKNLLVETTELLLSVPGISVKQTNKENGDNLLFSAIRGSQHAGVIKYLIRKGALMSSTNNKGEGALHLAAIKGNVKLVELFISRGLQLEARDKKGNTPLLSGSKHFNMIKYLIDNGASDNATNKNGNTFVHLAAENMADGHKFREFLDFILNNGFVEMFSLQNNCHQTPFHVRFWCKGWDNIDILKVVLNESKVNLNAEDNQGNTLLLSAVSGKMGVEILQALIDCGAVENYKNGKGKNVLHLALKDGNVKIVDFFLKRGFDLSQTNKKGFTPLDKAISVVDKYNKGSYVSKGTVKRLQKIISMLQDATKVTC